MSGKSGTGTGTKKVTRVRTGTGPEPDYSSLLTQNGDLPSYTELTNATKDTIVNRTGGTITNSEGMKKLLTAYAKGKGLNDTDIERLLPSRDLTRAPYDDVVDKFKEDVSTFSTTSPQDRQRQRINTAASNYLKGKNINELFQTELSQEQRKGIDQAIQRDNDIKTKLDQIAAIQAQIEGLQNTGTNLNQQKNTLNKQLADLVQQQNKLARDVQILEQACKECQNEYKNAVSQQTKRRLLQAYRNTRKASRNAELDNTKRDKNLQKGTYQTENTRKTQENKTLKTNITTLNSEIATLQQRKRDLSNTLNETACPAYRAEIKRLFSENFPNEDPKTDLAEKVIMLQQQSGDEQEQEQIDLTGSSSTQVKDNFDDLLLSTNY